MFAYVPLVVLAVDVVEALPRQTSTVGVLVLLLLVCAWIQRDAYRDLRGAKSTYGRVVVVLLMAGLAFCVRQYLALFWEP